MYLSIIVLIINFLYFVVELVSGFYFNSTALKTDAFHMLADILAISISIYCEHLSKFKKNNRVTFGWNRAKILGGFTNTVFLISTCVFLFIESITKFFEKDDIDVMIENIDIFIIIAAIGLVINLVSVFLYNKIGISHGHSHGDRHEDGHGHSINTKALMLHFLGDTLGSIIVMISGFLIKYDNKSKLLHYYDPICSLIIIFIIAFPTFKLYYKSFKILLQYSPKKIESDKLKKEIQNLPFVISIHELHIWQLDEKIIIGTIHFQCNGYENIDKKCILIKKIFHKFGIHSTTIQPEFNELCIEPSCDDNTCNQKKCCNTTDTFIV